MTARSTTATALVAVVAAAAAGSASPGTSAFRACGTVKGGGASWSVVAAGVSCSAGKPLVRKLAAKPHSTYTRLGTYLGLKCIELAGKGKREISCISTDGRRSLYGVTPARKGAA
jgi:hypothetical protein